VRLARTWRQQVGPVSFTLVKLPYGARQVRITFWGKNEVRDLRLHCRYLSGADREDWAMAEDLLDDPDLTARADS
jgi:hypothetical protein